MKVTELDKCYAAELKALRKQHKIKQGTLYVHFNLTSQQQYSDLENGKKHFTSGIILKVCSLFHISVLKFITNKRDQPKLSTLFNTEDHHLIENSIDNEIKIIGYKKLYLESQIENIELKLKMHHNRDIQTLNVTPSRHKVHVII